MAAPNNSFKPTPCRGVSHVLCATLARVRRPATGRLNSGVRPMPKHARPDNKSEIMRVSFRASVKFERILQVIRETYESSDNKNGLCVPYIVMCAAALEAILNDALLQHASSKWGYEQKDYANSLMSMSFRNKLNSLAPLLTSHKYRFDKNHWVYQRLGALISERNNLVHPKPQEHDIPITRGPHPVYGGTQSPILPDEYYDLADDLTLGSGKKYSPQEYHEAIEKFDKWFLQRLPDRVSKVALLVPNAKV